MASTDRPLFHDRAEAGRAVADRLGAYRGPEVLVLGIPRGGVVVAAEVARRLDAQLDIMVARKLGAPGSPELAAGAVTADGGRFLNDEIIRTLGIAPSYLEEIAAQEMAEARRREAWFRGGRPGAPVNGRSVILVDDGLATGATMRAGVRSLRNHQPARVIVAVPVGARDAVQTLRREADDVVCPYQPEPFGAVGFFYVRFDQVDDATVRSLLEDAHQAPTGDSTRQPS